PAVRSFAGPGWASPAAEGPGRPEGLDSLPPGRGPPPAAGTRAPAREPTSGCRGRVPRRLEPARAAPPRRHAADRPGLRLVSGRAGPRVPAPAPAGQRLRVSGRPSPRLHAGHAGARLPGGAYREFVSPAPRRGGGLSARGVAPPRDRRRDQPRRARQARARRRAGRYLDAQRRCIWDGGDAAGGARRRRGPDYDRYGGATGGARGTAFLRCVAGPSSRAPRGRGDPRSNLMSIGGCHGPAGLATTPGASLRRFAPRNDR